jgi:mannosyltransferase
MPPRKRFHLPTLEGAVVSAPQATTFATLDRPDPRRPADVATASRPRWTRWPIHLLPGLVPGLLMVAVALVEASRPVLSWDEVSTIDVARRSPVQIWHLIHSIDAVFGTYYYFMHFWISLAGTTELALRLPSIVAMAAGVALAGELGRRFFGPLTGTVAGLFLCLVPNTSRYAAEARPYAFAFFFALLAVLLLHRALDRPGALRWLAYGSAVLLMGLAHIIALTTLGAHVVVLILHRRSGLSRRTVISWVATAGLVSLALLPVIWLGVHERDAQLAWVPPLTLGSLRVFPAQLVGSAEGAWLLIGLVLFALWRPVRHLTELTFLIVAPVAVVATASLLSTPYWVARYLLFILAPIALLAAAGLLQPFAGRGPDGEVSYRGLRTPILRLLTVFPLLAAAVYPGQLSVRGPTAKNGSDYRSAAQIIHGDEQPGDGVVYKAGSRTLRAGTDYYLRHDPNPPRDLLLARSAADVGQLRAVEFPDPATHIAGTPRLWLLVDGRRTDPTTVRPDVRPILAAQYQRTGIWYLHHATLALFVRR